MTNLDDANLDISKFETCVIQDRRFYGNTIDYWSTVVHAHCMLRLGLNGIVFGSMLHLNTNQNPAHNPYVFSGLIGKNGSMLPK
jgi:hypothetical protein